VSSGLLLLVGLVSLFKEEDGGILLLILVLVLVLVLVLDSEDEKNPVLGLADLPIPPLPPKEIDGVGEGSLMLLAFDFG
jgi:hypothetical protein